MNTDRRKEQMKTSYDYRHSEVQESELLEEGPG